MPLEEFNSLDVTAPLIALPISREGIQVLDFHIPSSEEIAAAQSADAELKQLRKWTDEKQAPSTDKLAPQSGHLKCFAQLLSEILLHDSVIFLRRLDAPEREPLLVPSFLTGRVIRVFREDPGKALQVDENISAQVVRGVFSLELLTIICCCIRFEIYVSYTYQSFLVIISAVIDNFITVYSTSCPIYIFHNRKFESSYILAFLNYIRFHKIKTISHHFQLNEYCKRLCKTFKSGLKEVSHEFQFPRRNLYLNFVVLSYSTSIHFSIKFSTFYLMLGSKVRLPSDLKFGSPSSQLQHESSPQRGPFPSLHESFSTLSRAFTSVRENLRSFISAIRNTII